MDVYVGFGLLSAAVVVLLFIFVDSLFKSRRTRMAEMIGSNDASADDPEFNLDNESHDMDQFEIQEDIIDEVHHPIRSESIVETEHTAELIEDDDDYHHHEPTLNNREFHKDPYIHRDDANDEMSTHRGNENVARVNDTSNHENIHRENDTKFEKNTPPMPDSLLILSVMAKPNCRFVSYDLLQAISTVGLQYGEMNIFHYYQQTMTGKMSLFSLASANKPGDFDLDNIGDFSCAGLVFFMDIARVPDPQNVFRLMLETAERLADYLDGALHADPRTPWNEKFVWQYQQKIMQYKTMARYDNTVRA